MSIRVKEIELMLLGWRETHNAGFTVTFAVAPEDGEFFKAKTVAKGKIAGQIFVAALAEVGGVPDKSPVTGPTVLVPESFDGAKLKPRFPDGLCGLAVRWCDDAHFQEWLQVFHAEEWEIHVNLPPSDRAKAVVCATCRIDSRKQLDTAIGADRIFRTEFLEPYAAAREADGIDE